MGNRPNVMKHFYNILRISFNACIKCAWYSIKRAFDTERNSHLYRKVYLAYADGNVISESNLSRRMMITHLKEAGKHLRKTFRFRYISNLIRLANSEADVNKRIMIIENGLANF